jgi:squalene-hopene/tetraprenyl-beta-curcumene cyclase
MQSRALAAACVVVTAGWVTGAIERSSGSAETWDQASVARYLDARMDLWWARAKNLKTGDTETKCLSCHTAVPYALVRPALRRAQGAAAPTAHEERIFEIVRQRVEHLDTEQPYYDHTEAKKLESRGVEAVINALVLTSRDGEEESSEPSALTRAAMARLWEVQRDNGAWDWLNFGLEPYEAPDAVFYGATVAAIAAGSHAGMLASSDARGQAGIERLRAYLRANTASQRLFNRAWALIASSRFDGTLTSAERDAVVRDLERHQRRDGGWSLTDLGTWRWTREEAPFAPPGSPDDALLAASDGYATGLVVYAMRKAAVAADRAAVARGQQWLRSHQTTERPGDLSWAPWRAHSLNFDREHGGDKGEPWRRMFMSDLATAFAALALL